ncbi:MAG TPA: hypothetical protein VGL66_03535 [Caulobacteraceae bacterium]|jgi:hypothetical protein
MATYTIYFLDDRKVIVSFDLVECADDQEAWSHAPRLLKVRTDSRNVEIFQDGRHVPPPSGSAVRHGDDAGCLNA